jgi:hypothetical protein
VIVDPLNVRHIYNRDELIVCLNPTAINTGDQHYGKLTHSHYW